QKPPATRRTKCAALPQSIGARLILYSYQAEELSKFAPMPRSAAPLAFDCALEEEPNGERIAIAAKQADDLDAERKTPVISEARNIDAWRAHQRPQPVEDR